MNDRRLVVFLLALSVGAVFFGVLFQGEQFAYRDTADFYYPLYEAIQSEWQAGRVPLWNPYESSGTPLLANPTAAVFYPAKLIFFLPVSYGLSFRLYVVLHVLLCALGAYRMTRAWGCSRPGAGLGGLAYALSGAVLAQCSNVTFLVGAAWTPLALVCAERVVRRPRPGAVGGLGLVLALQVLGGDPQAAYVCGLLSLAYAVAVAWAGRSREGAAVPAERFPRSMLRSALALAAAAGVAALLSLVQVLPALELSAASERASRELPRNVYELPGAWLRGGALPEVRDGGTVGQRHGLTDALLGAGPDEAKHTYRFSAGPWRWMEFVWPGVTGRRYPLNRHWPRRWPAAQDVWSPSLYLGLVPLVLAGCALRLRRAPPQQVWLLSIALFGLAGALGRFGPVAFLRLIFGDGAAGRVGDEVGGLYWLLTVALPGFADFRYPAKLLVFAALGLAGLAAFGWDRLVAGDALKPRRAMFAVAAASAALLLVSLPAAGALESWLAAGADAARDPYYGPFDAAGARGEIQRALLHAVVIGLAALGLLRAGARARWRLPVAAALLLLASADVVLANRWLIQTVPQADYDAVPHALSVVRDRQAWDGDDAPFRIYRPGVLYPIGWSSESSTDRVREILRWNRDSLKPKAGLPYGVEDMAVRGTLNLRTYHYVYTGWPEPTDAQARRRIPELPPTTIRHSALAFDAWNVKYFILPRVITPSMVADQHRSVQSFLYLPSGAPAEVLYTAPRETMAAIDYQIVLNPDRYPRAFVVHDVERIPELESLPRDERLAVVRSLIVDRRYDLRRVALVAGEGPAGLPPAASPGAAGIRDEATIVRHDPGRVDIDVEASAPGLLVLADAFYPGWEARVDDRPAPILRTNLMMRGVAVPAGRHRVTFSYNPASFRWGAGVSALAWLALAVAAVLGRARRAERPVLQGGAE